MRRGVMTAIVVMLGLLIGVGSAALVVGRNVQGAGIPLYSILSEKAQKAAIAFSPRQLLLMMVLLTAIAGAVAGGISMAAGEYLATKSQDEVFRGEMALEEEHFT